MDKFVRQRQLEIQENIFKSVSGSQVSGNKGFPVGTVRYWNGKRYKKKINGDWVYSPEKDDKRKEEKQEKQNKELTEEEIINLTEYTNYKYRDINNVLRGKDKMTPGVQFDIENLKSVIDKLPSYKGMTYRGINEKGSVDEIKEKYNNIMDEDNILEYDGFLSTTKDKDMVTDFVANDKMVGVVFNIQTNDNSNSSDVSKHSVYPKEKEVLFKNDSQFEVTNVRTRRAFMKDFVEVDLKEI